MKAQLELISPEKAGEYLTKNVGNRPLSPMSVLAYARDMVAGLWNGNTGEAIKFDTNGYLRDGQNRLTAIIKAQVSIQMLVIRGIHPDAFSVLDSGKSRTAGEVLAIAGIKDYNKKATLAKAIILYEQTKRGTVLDTGSGRTNGATMLNNQSVLAFVQERDRDLNLHVRRAAGYYDRWRVITPGQWAFFDWLFSSISAEASENFMSMLAGGSNIANESHPCAFVRRKVNNSLATSGSRPKPGYMYALIITAWNLYRNRRIMRSFIYEPNGDRIEPI